MLPLTCGAGEARADRPQRPADHGGREGNHKACQGWRARSRAAARRRAQEPRQVGRRSWRPWRFHDPSHCALHPDCVTPLGAWSRRLRPRMLHSAECARRCRPNPCFGTEESAPLATFQPTRGERSCLFIKCREPDLAPCVTSSAHSRRGTGDEMSEPVPRRDCCGARSSAKGSVSMTTAL